MELTKKRIYEDIEEIRFWLYRSWDVVEVSGEEIWKYLTYRKHSLRLSD